MKTFADFDSIRRLDELLNPGELSRPKNGHWMTPVHSNQDFYEYQFDVEGEDCGDERCYYVEIDASDNTAEISFAHAHTHYADRPNSGAGLGVMGGVIFAIKEWLSHHSPEYIEWFPNMGSAGANPMSRANVYAKWAARNLFPKYLPKDDTMWIRRDIYEQKYVPRGYPAPPDGSENDRSTRMMGVDAEAFANKVRMFEKSKQATPAPAIIPPTRNNRNTPPPTMADHFSFSKWCLTEELNELELLSELFDSNEISSFQPKNGGWENQPADSDGTYVYRFDVEGDPEECDGPCYSAVVSYYNKSASIAFKHEQTRYSDRGGADGPWQSAGLDSRKLGTTVMYSVLKALMEFIHQVKPAKLSWSAVQKSTRNATNTDARKKVYFAWAVKNLFPHSYVPVDAQVWWSVDYFNEMKEKYPSVNWPTIPERGSSSDAKRFIEEMYNVQDEIDEAESQAQRERERQERERIERQRQLIRDSLPQLIEDEDYNPHQIKVGGIVRSTHSDVVFEVENISVTFDEYSSRLSPILMAHVISLTGLGSADEHYINRDEIKVDYLRPYEPPTARETFEVGDTVKLTHSNSKYTVKSLDDPRGKGRILLQSMYNDLYFQFPGNLMKVDSEQPRPERSSSFRDGMIADTRHNPQQLKVGDVVKDMHGHSDRTYFVVRFERASNELFAYLKNTVYGEPSPSSTDYDYSQLARYLTKVESQSWNPRQRTSGPEFHHPNDSGQQLPDPPDEINIVP